MANRITIFVLLVAIELLIISSASFAKADTITYDYTNDFHSYARKVAQLNQEQQDIQPACIDDGKKHSTTYLVALLCKTDGREIDFSEVSPLYIVAGPRNRFTLFFSSYDQCMVAVSNLKRLEGIIYVEPDCEVHANSIHDEESQPAAHSFHSWGASQMNLGNYLDYTEIWGTGSASIAVVDSGVFPHSLIRGKILSSGYDYIDGDEDSLNDLFGHGTNVAGIIADCTAGKSVYIYPIRVLDNKGSGKMSNVVNAVYEAKTQGVNIINLSLESTVMSEALDDAILEAVSSGVTVVVAAGNSSCNTSEVCPAHLTNSGVIVVGAAEGSNGSYNLASYSNYGSSVDVYAFGTGITCCSRSGGYSSETGTSMAAPHISALCAMMHLIHPGLSPGQVERRLQIASVGTGSIIVPNSSLMIPVAVGFNLSSVKMTVGDLLTLPAVAFPESANETITYQSSDEQIVVFQNDSLMAIGNGTATINVSCKGFDNTTFQVTVDDFPISTICLPETLEKIEDEAFYGASFISKVIIPESVYTIGNSVFENCDFLQWIMIPNTVMVMGENTFSEAIILCSRWGPIYEYSVEHGLQYITLDKLK